MIIYVVVGKSEIPVEYLEVSWKKGKRTKSEVLILMIMIKWCVVSIRSQNKIQSQRLGKKALFGEESIST